MWTLSLLLRASFDYNEEVHLSIRLGVWSNMFGCEMGSSATKVYTMAKSCIVENFKNV
jgi:hypothetical protein